MSYLARLKAKIGEKPLTSKLTELTKGASVSFVTTEGEGFSQIEPESRSPIPATENPDAPTIERGVVIDIADHLARAQRIAETRNADAARRGETDRFCRCGEYARFAWRLSGRETWLCDRCERSFADD